MDKATFLTKAAPRSDYLEIGDDRVAMRGLVLAEVLQAEEEFGDVLSGSADHKTLLAFSVWALERCLLDDAGNPMFTNGSGAAELSTIDGMVLLKAVKKITAMSGGGTEKNLPDVPPDDSPSPSPTD